LAHVTVSPETFTMVDFDAATIASLTERLVDQVGFGDARVDLRIDETMPLARVRIASVDPVALEVDGGALEDPKRLRQYDARGAARVLGRLLFQAKDLGWADFGTPPERDDLPLPHRVAWDTYAVGRVARLGYDAQEQRWRYAFRTRHGFTDDVDRAFGVLWDGDGLTWDDIVTTSDRAVTSTAA
jgi:hypothetical protein